MDINLAVKENLQMTFSARESKESPKLVLVGAGEFADIAHEYFTYDSSSEVVAFAVERAFLTVLEHRGLPVVAVEDLEAHYPPDAFSLHVAVTNTKLNRVRERLVENLRARDYLFASYISSRAFVWRTVKLGENVFVFENNVLQHGVEIGSGVILWSGNHIGHQTKIGDFTFISSHVVVSGYCNVGKRCFLGVNATFADHVSVGDDCFVAMAAVINKSYEQPGLMLNGHPAEPAKVTSYRFFKLRPESNVV